MSANKQLENSSSNQSKNIDTYKYIKALLLADLYDQFPIPINLNQNSGDYEKYLPDQSKNHLIFSRTVEHLIDEGVIKGSSLHHLGDNYIAHAFRQLALTEATRSALEGKALPKIMKNIGKKVGTKIFDAAVTESTCVVIHYILHAVSH